MQCFNVVCIDDYGKEYSVGVMTIGNEHDAMSSAEKTLFEGKHVKTHAVKAIKTDKI